MMIKLGSGDRIEDHLNPSRRKIPAVGKHSTPPTAATVRQQKFKSNVSSPDPPVKRCLFSDLERKESSTTEAPQSSAVLEENQYLHSEIVRLQQINRKLERHIDCRDKHLSKLHQDLKQLLLKYNDEVTRVKDDLYKELQESRRSQEISQIRPNSPDNGCDSKSSASSLENILQMKETLDRMDFRLEPHSNASFDESLALEVPTPSQIPFRF